MHLISERVAAGLDVNPGKMGKDSTSKHLWDPSKANPSVSESIKRTLLGGSDARWLHPGLGVGILNLLFDLPTCDHLVDPRPRKITSN